MAQKTPILLHAEAKTAMIQTINYFLQQGMPSYELKAVLDSVLPELNALVESDLKKAEEEYQAAVQAEQDEVNNANESAEDAIEETV